MSVRNFVTLMASLGLKINATRALGLPVRCHSPVNLTVFFTYHRARRKPRFFEISKTVLTTAPPLLHMDLLLLRLSCMIENLKLISLKVNGKYMKGGCDEELGLFLYRGSVDNEIIKQLQGKETGLRDHGEQEKKVVVIGATNRKQDLDAYSKLVNIFWNVVYALTTAEFESKVSDLVVFLFL